MKCEVCENSRSGEISQERLFSDALHFIIRQCFYGLKGSKDASTFSLSIVKFPKHFIHYFGRNMKLQLW